MQSTPYTPVGGAAPVAQGLQGFGRGNDSMLMHVTPGEVQGLQQLAMAHGGSLTTNPHTGLPEAGFLESILPMIAGGLLAATGVGAPLAAAIVGGGTGLITGDLKQGLMAGLGAFGGAGLAGALGAGAAAAPGAVAATAPELTTTALTAAPAPATTAALLPSAPNAVSLTAPSAASAANTVQAASLANPVTAGLTAAPPPFTTVPFNPGAPTPDFGMLRGMLGQDMGGKVANFGQNFADATAIQGIPRAATTTAAASGIAAPVMDAMAPKPYMPPEEKSNYAGPYRPTDRQVRFRGPNANLGDSSEFSYFGDTNPYPGFMSAPQGYAQGGPVGDFGPSMMPGQQSYSPPVDMSRFGTPPMLGGPPSSMGSAPSITGDTPSTGMPPSTATDRMLRRPGSEYRAGTGAEHNWNFRPVSQPGGMPGMPGMGQGMGYGGGLGAPPMTNPGGKGLGALMAAVRSRGAPADYGPARSFQYDPRSQSVSDMQGFASGGVALKDGAFVMDARTVSEMGNGSSGAGQELLARHGGKPIRGPGDGVSDSIPAKVGRQPARVARDEVKFDPEAVRRIGGGNPRKGAERLYALMDKAHKARRTAGRGADTKLRKAL
jgi:hypothetical protein